MVKPLRIIVPGLVVALLAACSVPVSEESLDLGLNLESQRIAVRRVGPPLSTGLNPAQTVMHDYQGEIQVVASKVDSRLTLTSLEIPIEMFADVTVTPANALDHVDSVDLRDFVISFSVSDGSNSVDIGSIALPVLVSLDFNAGAGSWEIDAAADVYSLMVLPGVIGQVSNIVTGAENETFTFAAQIEFSANLPDELESIEFTIEDGPASVKGRAKVI